MRYSTCKWVNALAVLAFPALLGVDCGGPTPRDLCLTLMCEDGEECTSDVCSDNRCSNPPVADGTSCEGGDGSCQNGSCEPRDPSCVGVNCNDSNECTSDVCAGGQCSNPPVSSGTSCNNGNGTCQGGMCEATGDPCAGVDCNDSNECTQDSCAAGTCSNLAYREGLSCDGGTRTCQNGACRANADPCAGKDCSDGEECTLDECAAGVCSNPSVADGVSCDGGSGVCTNGACQPKLDVPSTPQITNIEFPSLSSVRLEWTDSDTETAYELEYSFDNVTYEHLADLPANQTFDVITELPPCSTTYLRIRARNAQGVSGYYGSGALLTNVAAIIDIAPTLNSPFIAGRHFIDCWNASTEQGGIAIYDNDGNGILDGASRYDFASGSNSYIFPRVNEADCALCSTTHLEAGRAYHPGANLVAYFKFNTWSSNEHENYVAAYFSVASTSVSSISMWGGDMRAWGFFPGIAMVNQTAGVAYNVSVLLPQAGQDSYIIGNASAFISMYYSDTGIIYSGGVAIVDMNLPIVND